MIHVCTNCYKTFKTTQHLNQHKNRKRTCEPSLESKNNSNNLENDNNIVTSYNFLSENNPSQNNTSENNTSENNTSENNTSQENTSEENKNTVSVENLSVINLLEFVNTHKKILEEKNKLESTLIIFKKHLDNLTRENFSLKNKINIVNDFITNYKSNSLEDFTSKYAKSHCKSSN
jgi:hypothetical protein